MNPRAIARWALALAMVAVGITHFVGPASYVAMVPPQLPAPLALVYISGVAEIVGGIGLLIVALRRAASFGLIALYIAVFPANVHMAIDGLPLSGQTLPAWVLWARLPLQALFIAWAYWVGKPNKKAASDAKASQGDRPQP